MTISNQIPVFTRHIHRTGNASFPAKSFFDHSIFIFPDGYTDNDVTYHWTEPNSIQLASGMTLSQFDLVAATKSNDTRVRLGGQRSNLRSNRTHLIQLSRLVIVMEFIRRKLNRKPVVTILVL